MRLRDDDADRPGHAKDVAAARAAGWQAVWLARGGDDAGATTISSADGRPPGGVARIDDLRLLIDLL